MTTPLQKAARELLDKYATNSTAIPVYMFGELRKALDAELVQTVEPVYQFRQKPTWLDEDVEWTPWVDCSKATFDNLTSTDNWLYQVRKLYLHPPQQVVPDGYVIVPIEPTPRMSAAGFCVPEAEHDPAGVYKAMLAAAQGEKP